MVLAGGSGSRVGAERNKVLLPLGGEPLLRHSVRRAAELTGVVLVVVVVRPGDEADVEAALEGLGTHAEITDDRGSLPPPGGGAFPRSSGVPLVTAVGGPTRHASELSALRLVAPYVEGGRVDVVAVHDAARPLASSTLWEAVVAVARKHGGALPVRPAAGIVTAEALDGPLEGEEWVGVQTPQAFRAGPLLASYLAAQRDGFEGTDTAACVAAYTDLPVVAVPGEASNLKVTYADDLVLAERLLRQA